MQSSNNPILKELMRGGWLLVLVVCVCVLVFCEQITAIKFAASAFYGLLLCKCLRGIFK